MFDNYFFLTRIVRELNKELKGLKFFKSVSQSKNEIVTGFFNDKTEKYLVFTFQKLPPFIFIRDDFTFAKKNFVSFFTILSDKSIENISIDDYERNIRIKFGEYTIVILFRASHSNVFLIDSNETVIESFKKSQHYLNKKLSEVINPDNFDRQVFENQEKFNSIFNSQNKAIGIYRKILGDLLIDEIIFRSRKTNKTYYCVFCELIDEINNSPLYVYENGIVSFCKLQHLNSTFEVSTDIFSSLAKIYFLSQKETDVHKLKSKLIKKLNADYEHHLKKIQNLRKPENFIDRAEEFRQYGNLILISHQRIKKGDKCLITNFEGKDYKIKLDPAKNPFENAQIYFEKARGEESRIKSLNKLIDLEEKELEKIKKQIEFISNTTDIKTLMNISDEKSKGTKETDFTKNFRHFIINGKYDVYVGKDSKSNDLLTLEFAKPDDLWFHARGVSGSHLILRRQNKKEVIPKNVIEKAASIAAFYSKAKHSKLVPVAYTERKYVIKRKGMPSGTVQLQKEKVILVEPKLPEDQKNGEQE